MTQGSYAATGLILVSAWRRAQIIPQRKRVRMSFLMIFDEKSNSWVKVPEGDFKDETKMQEMIKDNPELIPIDDLADVIPRMMVVGVSKPSSWLDRS